MDVTEIKIEKRDSDDIEDFTFNMEIKKINSNVSDTPQQDDLKSEIKQESSDENEAIPANIHTHVQSDLLLKGFKESFLTSNEGKMSWFPTDNRTILKEEYKYEMIIQNPQVKDDPENVTVIKEEPADQDEERIDVIEQSEENWKLDQCGLSKVSRDLKIR